MGDMERGFSDTGYIPEEGDDLGKLSEMAKKEEQEDKKEKAMAKKYGWEVEEKVGGFIERNNRSDRM